MKKVFCALLLSLLVMPYLNSSVAAEDKTFKEPVTGMEFVWIPGGCYEMGCGKWTDNCDDDEYPVHEVCIDGFWMGRYEVTVAQYLKFVKEKNAYQPEWLEEIKGESLKVANDEYYTELGDALTGENHPVVGIAWEDAVEFAKWLSKRSGKRFRLPTEAEWEYVCRNGGKKEKYTWGNGDPVINGKKAANIPDETAGKKHHDWKIWKGYDDGYVYTAPVGSFAPNELGVYDIIGNVWEWIQEGYSSDAYKQHSRKNPVNKDPGVSRVVRGGSWYYKPWGLRCSNRSYFSPDMGSNAIGFRLVMTE